MPLQDKLIKTLFLEHPDIKAADVWIALCKDYVESYSGRRIQSFFFTNPHLSFVKTSRENYIPELYLELLVNRTSLNFEKPEIVLKQLADKLSHQE
jgi:hypothetical protein